MATRLTFRTLTGAVGVAGLVLALLGAVPAQAAVNRTLEPGSDVRVAIGLLRAGDTLVLAPGTYRTGWIVVRAGSGVLQGTSTAPITITSADPHHPAVLIGGLELDHARYVRLSNINIVAARQGFFALYMLGGIGWQVSGCDLTGARATHAVANVMIDGSGGEPANFRFVQNNVHTAANDKTTDHVDQNIYVNYVGAPGSGGIIANNLIWDHPNGEGIKVGVGGLPGAPGAWNLLIAYNTIANGGRQIVLTGALHNITITRNHLYVARQFFVSNPQTTQIYIHEVTGTGFIVSGNYSFGSSMLIYDPLKRTKVSGNVQSNAVAMNPRFNTNLAPTNPRAVPFGRYARTI